MNRLTVLRNRLAIRGESLASDPTRPFDIGLVRLVDSLKLQNTYRIWR